MHDIAMADNAKGKMECNSTEISKWQCSEIEDNSKNHLNKKITTRCSRS